MGSRYLLCITLLVGCGVANAGRLNHNEVMNLHMQLEETVKATVAIESKDLTQLMTTAVGLITSTIQGFSEEPPDYEYAFDSIKSQGWKMVKIIVPEEKQKDRQFKNAAKAWKSAFGDVAELAEEVASGEKNGDDMIMELVSTGLETASVAFPDNAKYFDAYNKLFHGVVGSLLTFSREMGWREAAAALVEMNSTTKKDASFSQMLTTGVGVITSLISAFSEEEPDIEHAVDSLNLQGWKMVKLMVPKEEQRSKEFKRCKRAWDTVMEEATELIEDAMQSYKSGGMGKIISVLLRMVDTALQTTAEILVAEKAFLEALKEFIGEFGHSILDFSVTMGWINEF